MNGLLTSNPDVFRELVMTYLLRAVAMLLVIPAHEAAHAFVSDKLGDSTAKDMGRLSLNPMAHFDPLGALCMVMAGIGWAKPVPTRAYRFRNPKLGMALTAAAGPAVNLLLAYLTMILYKLVYYLAPNMPLWELAARFLVVFLSLNVSLAVFNLLPIPPFDGSRVATVFLPTGTYFRIMKYERYIMITVLLLVWTGLLSGPLSLLNSAMLRLMSKGTGFVEYLLFSV